MFHWLQNISGLNCKNSREKSLQFESEIKSRLADEAFIQYNTFSTCGETVKVTLRSATETKKYRRKNLNNFFSQSYKDA